MTVRKKGFNSSAAHLSKEEREIHDIVGYLYPEKEYQSTSYMSAYAVEQQQRDKQRFAQEKSDFASVLRDGDVSRMESNALNFCTSAILFPVLEAHAAKLRKNPKRFSENGVAAAFCANVETLQEKAANILGNLSAEESGIRQVMKNRPDVSVALFIGYLRQGVSPELLDSDQMNLETASSVAGSMFLNREKLITNSLSFDFYKEALAKQNRTTEESIELSETAMIPGVGQTRLGYKWDTTRYPPIQVRI